MAESVGWVPTPADRDRGPPTRSLASQSPPTNMTQISGTSLGWRPVARARDCASHLVSARTLARCAPLWRGCFGAVDAALWDTLPPFVGWVRQAVPLGALCAPPRSHLGARWCRLFTIPFSERDVVWWMGDVVVNVLQFNSIQWSNYSYR